VKHVLVLAAAVAGLVCGVAAATPPPPPSDALRALIYLREARGLELEAFQYKAEPIGALTTSIDLLQRAQRLLGNRASSLIQDAIDGDRQAMNEFGSGPTAGAQTVAATLNIKDDAISEMEADQVDNGTGGQKGDKKAKATAVAAPACRSSRNANAATASCTRTSFWDVNVALKTRFAVCTFRAGGKVLRAQKPLFPGTTEFLTCEVTKKTRVVHGVRKRIVHAELWVVAPGGFAGAAAKSVSLDVRWRTS
jgi:hypothetical protein